MLSEIEIRCPYCGETITVFADSSAGDQNYIEDCAVCCRPIEIALTIDADGDPVLNVRRDDD